MPLEPLLRLGDGLALSVWTLIAAGLAGGVTAGLMGIGGGVIVNPILIALGVPPRISAASMSVAIVANASGATLFNLRKQRVDVRLGLCMGAAGVAGGLAGTALIRGFGRPETLDSLIRGAFVVLLLLLAWRMSRGGNGVAGGEPSGWLRRLPLRYLSPLAAEPVSPLPAMAAALGVGLVSALLGVGGGVFYIPLLLALFHRDIREVVPVSQIAVLLANLAVGTGHVFQTGNIDPRLALVLIVSGSVGTAVGSRLKQHLEGGHVQRLFALVLVLGSGRMAWQLLAPGAPAAEPALDSAGAGALDAFGRWCASAPWRAWLGTVGLALAVGPLLTHLQHKLVDRLER